MVTAPETRARRAVRHAKKNGVDAQLEDGVSYLFLARAAIFFQIESLSVCFPSAT